MSVTIYTANLGAFDNLRSPRDGCRGARFLCYADEPVEPPEPFEILPAYRPYPGDPARNTRTHKMLSHLFTETEYSIWMDANFVLAIDPNEAIERWLTDADIAVFRHPGRSCLYAEARQCLLENIGRAEEIERQIAYYESCGFPPDQGLYACGVILRRHTPEIIRLNERWWAQVRDFSARDQIGLPFVLHEQGVSVKVIEADIFANNRFVWKWHGWKTDHAHNLEFVERNKLSAERKARLYELCPPRGDADADGAEGVVPTPAPPPEFSVVILSENADNLIPCVRAVMANEPDLPPDRIIVVDDGARAVAESKLPGIRWVSGEKPFNFARNANLGVAKSTGTIILLNDDALLLTPGGFSSMCRAAAGNPEFGVISATTNLASNPAQHPRGMGLREDTNVAFVCALIPREAWESIGVLDERYCLDYGVEDRDYCHRIALAGMKVGISDDCFVDHGYLTSSYRGEPHASRSFERNYNLFKEKWGIA